VVDVRYSVEFPTGYVVNYDLGDGEYKPCNLNVGENAILRFNLADKTSIDNN
jgi:hypothetical protein